MLIIILINNYYIPDFKIKYNYLYYVGIDYPFCTLFENLEYNQYYY